MSKAMLVLILLLSAVQVSAIGLVYTKHTGRKLFVELQAVRQQRDQLMTEFGQLQLEQSAWSSNGRVERIARAQLKMANPGIGAVEMLRQ
jgi:cell division protein FtsL